MAKCELCKEIFHGRGKTCGMCQDILEGDFSYVAFEGEKHFYRVLAYLTGFQVEWLAGEFFPSWECLKWKGSLDMERLLADIREAHGQKGE